jgi:hypothetical protein
MAYLRTEANCGGRSTPVVGGPSPYTSGLSASDALGRGIPVPANAAAGWTFAAPSGTAINAAVLDRDLFKWNDNGWLLFVSDQAGQQVPGQNCTIDPGVEYECEVSGALVLSGLSATSLSIGAICTSSCTTDLYAHNVRADLDHAVVTISDPNPPSAPTATGPLTSASWHSGLVTLNVSSTDAVGISQLQVRAADGREVGGVAKQCDYTYTVPCPQAGADPLEIDTTRVPDGAARLTLVAVDAAQNAATSSIEVLVANRPPARPSLSGAPPGWTAQPSATITAELPAGAVPVDRLDWRLCASTCTPVGAVRVPPGAARVSFRVTVPADGAYTIEATAVDAAGHVSPTATTPFYVDRSTPSATGGQPDGADGAAPRVVTLGSGSHARVNLPVTVGRHHLRLNSSLSRRAGARLELRLATSPPRSGRVRVGLAFDGHRAQRHTLRLRRGAAALVFGVPAGATRLRVTLVGFGASSTAEVLIARR